MNVTVITADNEKVIHGPKFYHLHRDKIRAEIAAIQARPGVACPCNVAQWRLTATDDKTSTYLASHQGRIVRFP